MLAYAEIRITLITVPPELPIKVMCDPPLPELWTPNLLIMYLGRNNSSGMS